MRNSRLIKMRGIKIMAMMALLIIAVSGCKSSGSASIADIDVRKGTEGLSMEFLKGSPPDKVFEDAPFSVFFGIHNKGAFDIGGKEGGRGVLVLGIENDVIGIEANGFGDAESASMDRQTGKILLNLEGKSMINPNGMQDSISIGLRTKKVGGQSESRKSTISATACYDYGTTLEGEICVDTDPNSLRPGRKQCSVKDLAFPQGQGAPVVITKVESQMLPSNGQIRPNLIIYIENKGKGEVAKPSIAEKVCSSGNLDVGDLNLLSVNAFLSDKELQCTSSRMSEDRVMVRLDKKQGIVRCVAPEGEGYDANLDSFVSPIRIELKYGYTFTISKEFIVERVLTH